MSLGIIEMDYSVHDQEAIIAHSFFAFAFVWLTGTRSNGHGWDPVKWIVFLLKDVEGTVLALPV